MGDPIGWREIDAQAMNGNIIWVSDGFSMRLAFWLSGTQYEARGTKGGGWIDFAESDCGIGLMSVDFLPILYQNTPEPPGKKGLTG